MCGIYGTTIKYSERQVKEKLQRTAYRGPDKMGWKFYLKNDRNVILGHNRLSIIDLDPRSDQPLTYNSDIHIVFNGEIYNFKTIKETLKKKGYQFTTTSDTEVMCAAYMEYGEDCVNHFNGMFAFVIYDVKNQKLFGARDRLGQKPFYYYHNGRNFEFASQISSIQMHHENLSISSNAIVNYLAWSSVPEPQTIFNEVTKLSPGHYFTYYLDSGKFDSKCYWDIDYLKKNDFIGTYEDAKHELNLILKDSVSGRLFADVPVGVFLSGGIDSSLVSAIASQTSSKKVKTFSVKFNEKGFDESVFAKQVADHLKTDHHIIECNFNEGIDLIEDFYKYYDEPFADSSAIPTMLLAKYTKKHVTVALSGDGGDESFIGYHRYNWFRKGSKIYSLPFVLRKMISNTIGLSPNYRHKIMSKALSYSNINKAYMATMADLDMSFVNSDIDYYDIDEFKYLNHNNKNLYERISDFDIKTYLNWDINTKVDRASMAYSLEVRSPLMDHRVIEFARSLPTSFKFQAGNQKRILKDILFESVPENIFNRPKAGFTMPFKEWFKNDLKEFVLSELNDEGLNTIPALNVDRAKLMINQHMEGTWNRYPLIWKLLVLKQWLNKNSTGLIVK